MQAAGCVFSQLLALSAKKGFVPPHWFYNDTIRNACDANPRVLLSLLLRRGKASGRWVWVEEEWSVNRSTRRVVCGVQLVQRVASCWEPPADLW